jgi:hypothetical protein
MKTWITAQLADPTNLLHGLGAAILAGEVLRHWITGHPVDLGTIGAGTGCFTIGGVIDHFQDKASP